MANLFAFVNSFLSYLLLFGVCVLVVIVACALGISLRKKKNEKLSAVTQEAQPREEA